MNLILQAVKSLFRKVENSISVNVATLSKRIDKSQATANTAKANAKTAHTTAETAKATAETAKATAETAKATAETAKATAETAKATAETAKATAEGMVWKVAGVIPIGSTGTIKVTIPCRFTELVVSGGLKSTLDTIYRYDIAINSTIVTSFANVKKGWDMTYVRAEKLDDYIYTTEYDMADDVLMMGQTRLQELYDNNTIELRLKDGMSVHSRPITIRYR